MLLENYGNLLLFKLVWWVWLYGVDLVVVWDIGMMVVVDLK